MQTPDAAYKRQRFGISWCWRFDHDWSVWLVRDGEEWPMLPLGEKIRWRFNCGPLHIVRFA